MEMNFLIIFCFALIVVSSCLFIAYFGKKWNLSYLTALSAGALLSLCFLDFLPHAFELNSLKEMGGVFILAGVMAQALADIYLLPKLGFLDKLLQTTSSPSAHHHSHSLSPGSVCSVTACLVICSFFDGIRLFAALDIKDSVAFATAVALFFHLLSEGFLVSVLAMSSGIKRRVLPILALCLACSLCAGALAGKALVLSFLSGGLIAFASGILIYICFARLLPFSLKKGQGSWLFIGLLLFSAFHFLIAPSA